MAKKNKKTKKKLTKNGEVDRGSLRFLSVVIEDLVVCFTSDGFAILEPRCHERDARLGLICVVVLGK